MKGSWELLTIKGIKLYVHWSFPLLIIYVMVSEWWRGGGFYSGILVATLVLAVFLTVILHELGHALMARRFGCRTKDIVLLPIGGMARMERLPEKPVQEILVAVAGPLVNGIIAMAVYVILYIERPLPSFTGIGGISFSTWPAHFFYANIALVLFNLLPAFPMDGGRILRGLLTFKLGQLKATRIAARIGQVIALGMIVLGFYANPFLVLIGVFIILAAQVESNYYTTRSILKEAIAGDITMREVAEIPAGQTLREAAKELLNSAVTKFIVIQEGRPVGVIDRNLLMECIGRHGQDVYVSACMSRELLETGFQDSLEDLFAKLQINQSALAVVRENGAIKGYIDLDNILEFIQYRQALAKYKLTADAAA